MNLKYCKDCRHFLPKTEECAHSNNQEIDFVKGGQRNRFTPNFLRSHEEYCGELAEWYKAKDYASKLDTNLSP